MRLSRLFLSGASVLALCVTLGAQPVLAQSDDAPSKDMTVDLIRLLVKQKIISQKNADALLSEAKKEASQARSVSAAPIPQARPEPPPPGAGVVRVPYVPKVVMDQIRDQVKQEVMQEAKDENWAQPETLPAWIRRITLSGDIRFRDEQDLYGANNIGSDGVDGIVNYAAFNANGPTDVNPNSLLNGIPILNTAQNRYNQLSIRARLGLTAEVTDGVEVGIRLATGNNNSPVSTTQLLGGGFTKNDIWLDQAYLKFQPLPWSSLTVGRMANPFFHTDLLYDENLNFDGAAANVQYRPPVVSNLGTFATIGAFPVGYIDSNFPTYSPTKSSDRTEWLLGGQVGADWSQSRFDWRFAVSIYDYLNAQGELSAPCPIYLGTKQCSTDDTTPAFMQKGNTLFLIRNIIPDPSNPTDYSQPQFAGLSFNYEELDGTTEFDFKTYGSYHLILDADYVRNLAYDPGVALRYQSSGVFPVTNYNPTTKQIESGPNAFMGEVTYGDPRPRKLWEWNIVAGYKYIQPDAVLDAFNDHDFHMGGTNAKGYFVKASMGIYDDTWVSARWFSANEVYGPPLAIDVFQLDLNAAF